MLVGLITPCHWPHPTVEWLAGLVCETFCHWPHPTVEWLARLVYETSPVVPLFTATFTVDGLVVIPHLPCTNATRVLSLSPLIPLLMGESNITLKKNEYKWLQLQEGAGLPMLININPRGQERRATSLKLVDMYPPGPPQSPPFCPAHL